jgi:hypothetical protein
MGESCVSDLDRRTAVSDLEKTGNSGTFRIREDLVEELLSIIKDSGKERMEGLHKTHTAVRKVVYDPAIIGVLHDFFGVVPIVQSSVLNVVNPAGTLQKGIDEECQKEFHYDVPDFKGLALFLYLNDVDRNGGHHVVIPGTNKGMTWGKMKSRRLSNADAKGIFGADTFLHVTGPSGTAFLEDTVCWHKRALSCRRRYALMVVYTLQRK